MTKLHIPAARRGSEATDHDQTSRRATRFDQRGIALQTVIIMVVLLAVAGAIAAVLLARGNEAANQLDTASLGKQNVWTLTSKQLCTTSGGAWQDPAAAQSNIAEEEVRVDLNEDGDLGDTVSSTGSVQCHFNI